MKEEIADLQEEKEGNGGASGRGGHNASCGKRKSHHLRTSTHSSLPVEGKFLSEKSGWLRNLLKAGVGIPKGGGPPWDRGGGNILLINWGLRFRKKPGRKR